MTKVFFKDPKRFGSSVHLPHVGNVNISEEGFFEVEDAQAAELLCDDMPMICTLNSNDHKKVVVEDAVANSPQAWENQLSKLTYRELVEMLDSVPEDQRQPLKKLQKKPLITALAKFMSENTQDEDEKGSEGVGEPGVEDENKNTGETGSENENKNASAAGVESDHTKGSK